MLCRHLRLTLCCVLAAACATNEIATQRENTATLVLRNRLDASGAPPLTTLHGLTATSRYVYVGQRDEQQLLMFTADGNFVKTIGRPGGGPGEFRMLMRFGLIADTLWTTDWTLRRLTFFNDTGSVLSTSAFEPGEFDAASRNVLYQWLPEAPTRDGLLLGFGAFTDARALADGRITRYPLLRSTRLGGDVDTLAWYSIEHWAMFLRGKKGGLYAVQPITTDNFAIYDGTGGKACTVERDFRPVREGVSEVVVQCIGVNGDSLWRRTLEFEATPISKHIVDSVRAQQHSMYRRSFSPGEVDASLRLPTHWPPLTEGFAGSDGALWLRGAAVDGVVTYTVLDGSGDLRYTIPVAERLRLLWADANTVWSTEPDENDVPMIARYTITAANR